MKVPYFFRLAAVCLILPLGSCGSDDSSTTTSTPANDMETSGTKPTAPPAVEPSVAPAPVQAAPAPGNTAAAPSGNVKHYTCPNNCKGSGGDAKGNCPVCGTAYVHNVAYHTQGNNTSTTTTSPNPAQATPSPAQNAAGVYHYTCLKGCAGGSGSAGKCASCGGDLAHNAVYHQ